MKEVFRRPTWSSSGWGGLWYSRESPSELVAGAWAVRRAGGLEKASRGCTDRVDEIWVGSSLGLEGVPFFVLLST